MYHVSRLFSQPLFYYCGNLCRVETAKLTYHQTFSSPGGPIILAFPTGDTTVKFRRGQPQQRRQIEVGYQKFAIGLI